MSRWFWISKASSPLSLGPGTVWSFWSQDLMDPNPKMAEAVSVVVGTFRWDMMVSQFSSPDAVLGPHLSIQRRVWNASWTCAVHVATARSRAAASS